MAESTPITIRLNEDELNKQVTDAVSGALKEVSMKFRVAADALDPEFREEEDNGISIYIENEVERRLKEERGA